MLKIASIVMLSISVLCALLDAYNLGILLITGYSWETQWLIMIARLALGASIAAFAWVAPFGAGLARNQKEKFAFVVFLFFAVIMTLLNMQASKAALAPGWKPIDGVSSPVAFDVGGLHYQTDDWFRDALAYAPNVILLALVVINVERGFRLSPEQQRKKLEEEIAQAQIEKERREKLEPLLQENTKQALAGFVGRARAVAGGVGINLPTRKARVLADLPSANDDQADDGPSSSNILTLVPKGMLTPKEVGSILGKITDRAVRDRLMDPTAPNFIPGGRRVPGRNGREVWMIDYEELKRAYPREVAKHELNQRKKAEREAIKKAAEAATGTDA